MAERLPLFPLGTVLFPGALLPLHIFEQRYRTLVDQREAVDPIFGVVLTRSGREVGDQPEVHDVGTSASLVEIARLPDGRSNLIVSGSRRFQVLDAEWEDECLVASVVWLDNPEGNPETLDEPARRVRALVARYVAAFAAAMQREIPNPVLPEEPVAMAYTVASLFPFALREKQELLASKEAGHMLGMVEDGLRRDLALLLSAGIAGAMPAHPERRFASN
ncbi:MAG: LON peptidase substrate-binding domain-containing protein [Thermomicrobiales bacterium]